MYKESKYSDICVNSKQKRIRKNTNYKIKTHLWYHKLIANKED